VLLSWDPASAGFWLVQDYFPEILDLDRRTFPPVDGIREVLGDIEVHPVPIPWDCTDGFLGAYWRRPEAYLDPQVRAAISAFSRVPDVEARIARIKADLASGAWARRNAELTSLPELDVGYRLLVFGAGDSP
jgi:hypothetical protein